jgi:hypothetical protein
MDKLFKVVCNPNNPKILAIGKNYVKHVKVPTFFHISDKEMGGDQPPKEPVIFMKPHSSLFPCPTSKAYGYPLPSHGREIHHEIEVFRHCNSVVRHLGGPASDQRERAGLEGVRGRVLFGLGLDGPKLVGAFQEGGVSMGSREGAGSSSRVIVG